MTNQKVTITIDKQNDFCLPKDGKPIDIKNIDWRNMGIVPFSKIWSDFNHPTKINIHPLWIRK